MYAHGRTRGRTRQQAMERAAAGTYYVNQIRRQRGSRRSSTRAVALRSRTLLLVWPYQAPVAFGRHAHVHAHELSSGVRTVQGRHSRRRPPADSPGGMGQVACTAKQGPAPLVTRRRRGQAPAAGSHRGRHGGSRWSARASRAARARSDLPARGGADGLRAPVPAGTSLAPCGLRLLPERRVLGAAWWDRGRQGRRPPRAAWLRQLLAEPSTRQRAMARRRPRRYGQWRQACAVDAAAETGQLA